MYGEGYRNPIASSCKGEPPGPKSAKLDSESIFGAPPSGRMMAPFRRKKSNKEFPVKVCTYDSELEFHLEVSGSVLGM